MIVLFLSKLESAKARKVLLLSTWFGDCDFQGRRTLKNDIKVSQIIVAVKEYRPIRYLSP